MCPIGGHIFTITTAPRVRASRTVPLCAGISRNEDARGTGRRERILSFVGTNINITCSDYSTDSCARESHGMKTPEECGGEREFSALGTNNNISVAYSTDYRLGQPQPRSNFPLPLPPFRQWWDLCRCVLAVSCVRWMTEAHQYIERTVLQHVVMLFVLLYIGNRVPPPPPVGRGGIRAAVFWCSRMLDGWPQLLTRQQGVTCVNSPPQVW